MALTAKQIADLNGAMEANRLAGVGTLLSSLDDSATALEAQALVRGSYTAVADDATANEAVIATGLDAIAGFIVQIFRAGVNVMEDAIVTASGGNLSVADGAATYAVTANDVINYIVW